MLRLTRLSTQLSPEETSATGFSAREPSACRQLQRLLRLGNKEVKDRIIRETIPDFAALMTDPVGNYLCQSCMKNADATQLSQIVAAIWSSLPGISCSIYGTRAVQTLIDEIFNRPALIKRVLDGFKGQIAAMAVDASGSHVIKELLNLPNEFLDVVYEEIRACAFEIATTRRGKSSSIHFTLP